MKGNFLDLEEKFCSFDTAKVVVLPVPYEASTSYLKGTVKAPEAIIAASAQVELFDETLLNEFYRCGIATAEPVRCGRGPALKTQQTIYRRARQFVRAGKFVLALGGEHSITPALVKAAAERCSGLTVLQIDAHADLRDEYEASRYSHACVMRRIYDMNIPAVAVGVRSFDKEQYEFIVANKLKIWTAADIGRRAGWVSQVVKQLRKDVYITLDADVLDPAYMPGTGAPEPGGLTYQQVVDLVFAVGRARNIVGADIVEVIPGVAGVVSEFTAAKLAYKIIAAAQLKDRK
jgi:agmatinase